MSISLVILIAVVICTAILYFEKKDRQKTNIPIIPLYRYPLLGNTVLILKNYFQNIVLQEILHGHKDFGPIFQLRVFTSLRIVFISDPVDLKHYLLDNFNNYPKGEVARDIFHDIFGDGIFGNDGEKWRIQRQTASSLFHFESMQSFIPVFKERAKVMLNVLEKKCIKDISIANHKRDSIDIQQIFARYTMDSIGEIGFGVSVDSLSENEAALRFCSSFDYVQAQTAFRFCVHPFWKILPKGKFERSLKNVDDFMRTIVENRKQEISSGADVSDRPDLLSKFLNAKNEEGKIMFTDQYLLDVLKNFLIAGRDTTAVCLTWAFYLLAEHPSIQERVLREILTVVGDNIDNLTYEHLAQLKYTNNFINETLRLYPSIPQNQRCAINDDILPSGYKIPAGTMIAYAPYAIHRLPSLWTNPDECNPDRWDTDTIRPYQFLAFHGGPRVCLGKSMAYQEIKVALCAILPQYRLYLSKDFKVEFVMSLSLPAKNGMHMYITHRGAPPSAV